MQYQNTEEKTMEQIVEEFEREEGVQSAPVTDSQSVVSNIKEVICEETLPETPKTDSHLGGKEKEINESLVQLIVSFGSFGESLFTYYFFYITDNRLAVSNRGTLDPFLTLEFLYNLLHGFFFGILHP